ncbi:retention module-containing protein [Halomonas beimenensis]|uniref:RapA2 cadherin-like domain-containing protein n=1 Tax=Halomonas beimenensis TaxID=475662 RepID=A0A291P6S8_9GAMM|nr:retention module-containing protein [Halomonas beimenensis]ATJ82594.1 hypothetical protein BEI_1607 [Halomonas beimenensis]
MTIATVVSITGQAWARDADGELRELSVGDSLQEGEILVTSDNGRVVLDFGDGLEPTAVPGGEEVAMTPELALDATVSAEEASAQDEDLEALLAALEEGEGDLLEDLEATAAGAGGGGGSDGGHSFVRLARISESVDPLAFGFGTNSLEGADQVELDPTLAAAEPAAPEPDDIPSVDTQDLDGDGDTVWEAALEGGSAQGGEGGEAGPGISTTTAGALQIDTGGDALALIEVQDANGDWIAIDSAGTLVQGAYGTLSVDPDGSWSYTLDANTLDHDDPTATGAGDQVQDPFAVRVTDDDGDVSPEATLTIDVNDDGPVAADDGVDGAVAEDGSVEIDVFANDAAGADGVNLATGIALASGPSQGSVVYNGDGTFTYTADAGAEGSDSFTYTLTDREGDTSTATVTLTIAEDSTPTVATPDLNEDGDVVWESALAGGSGGGTTTTAGTLQIDTGGDALALVEVQDANGDWIAIDSVGTLVQGAYGTLSVDPDGRWSYTLDANTLDHDDPTAIGAGDQVQDPFAVRVTDDDGDVSPEATLTIDVNDDGPVVADDDVALVEDGATDTASGNVLDNDASGADAPASFVAWGENAEAISVLSQYGELSLDEDGGYRFVLHNDAPAVQTLTAEDSISETLTYTMQDADGDTREASLTLTLTGAGDSAAVTVAAQGADSTVYEAGLSPDGSNAEADSETATGNFGVSATDGIASVTVGGTTFTLAELKGFTDASPSAAIDTGEGTLVLTGYQSGDGDQSATLRYAYTLTSAQTHGEAGNDTLSDTLGVSVTGAGGSSASGTLTIDIVDDVPTVNGADASKTFNYTGYIAVGALDYATGADELGGLVFRGFEDGNQGGLSDGTTLMSSDGNPVYWFGEGTDTLVGKLESGEEVFTASLNGDGSYSLTVHQGIDAISQFGIVDIGDIGISGGNGESFIVGAGSPETDDDVLVTAVQLGGTINTSAGDIGTDSQWVEPSTGIRFEFVTDIQSDGSHDGARVLTGAAVDIADVKGGATQTNVLLALYEAGSALFSSQSELLDTVSAIRYVSDGQLIELEGAADIQAALDSGSLHFVTDYTVSGKGGDYLVSGLVIDGVDEHSSVGIATDQGFDTLEVVNHESAWFAVNGLDGAAITHEPVDIGFDYAVLDGDGDETDSANFTVTLDPSLVGSDGNDVLTGSDFDELLLGAEGNDTLEGGLGADVFAWSLGDEGSAVSPAEDSVKDFTLGTFGTEANADKLDIADLLSGMSSGDDLSRYLQATEDTSSGTTTLHISSAGNMSAGDVSNADQSIVLEGVSMGGLDQAAFLQSLIDDGQLDIE